MLDGRDVAYYVEPVPFLGLLCRQRLKAQLHVYLGDDIVCTPGGVLERQSGSCDVVRCDAVILSDPIPETEPERRAVRTIPGTGPCPQSTGRGGRRGSIAKTAPVHSTLLLGDQEVVSRIP